MVRDTEAVAVRAVGNVESVAMRVNDDVPVAVGVPLNTPVVR
jgi:hypothetical protein